MNLGVYAPTPWLVIVFTTMASLACIVMFVKGHNMMMVPMAFSLGWIGLGYMLGQVGLDHSDTSAIIRSGLIILSADVVISVIIWLRGKRHESR